MFLNARLDGVSVVVKVKAGSKRSGLVPATEWLRVDVKAPAVDGRANAAVLLMLRQCFRCEVEILRGERDSRKVILLKGARLDAVEETLAKLQTDRLPDVRDGLTRIERLILLELHRAQAEFPGRRVPSAIVYGRVCEHENVNLDPREFEALLSRLARGA
ncbi:MAG: DUF167 domain-containing protein [Deltaproteobacteria bacterium]|nr:DUF167 domain-containing protein [Deltaproteobacteria bacterium]